MLPILRLVRAREFDEVGQPRHRAVVLQDLADHGRGRESRELREVAASLRVPGARQHTALVRHQRKDVARLHDVRRPRVLGHGDADRARTVGRGDAGGHAFCRLDRHGEVGAERGAVETTIGGRLSCRQRSSVSVRQISPRP